MKFHFYVWTHFYIPNDKDWTVDVRFYHLLQTVPHKQQLKTVHFHHELTNIPNIQDDNFTQLLTKNKKSFSDFDICKQKGRILIE